jgi:hypothetical protein
MTFWRVVDTPCDICKIPIAADTGVGDASHQCLLILSNSPDQHFIKVVAPIGVAS